MGAGLSPAGEASVRPKARPLAPRPSQPDASPPRAQALQPGADVEWRIQIKNTATQARELLSIEMPQTVGRMFTIKPPLPTPERPIRLQPGCVHTQVVKFSNRGAAEQGTFRQPLLFNFSTWLLEYPLTVTVAATQTMDEMKLLQPVSTYKPKPLPAANESERVLIPAFPPGRVCTLPGGSLYTSNSEQASKRELKAYDVPPNIVSRAATPSARAHARAP